MKSNKYKEKSNYLGQLIAQKRKDKKISQSKLALKMQK